uniref:Uncharacterized protein n=1 Tax=Arion vulgaris TaxID=1028688 RepID=A0A0B7BAD3_9EUPU
MLDIVVDKSASKGLSLTGTKNIEVIVISKKQSGKQHHGDESSIETIKAVLNT